MSDFYTFKTDLRPFGGGTPISYNYDKAQLVTGEDDIEQGEMVGLIEVESTEQAQVVRFTRDALLMGAAQVTGVFAGIARDSAKGIHRLGNQPALNLDVLSVFTTGVHLLVGETGVEFEHGDVVYMADTDTTEITTVQGTGGVAVGTVHLPIGAAITGDDKIRIPVLIDEYTISQSIS
jgi:hypothetical protein